MSQQAKDYNHAKRLFGERTSHICGNCHKYCLAENDHCPHCGSTNLKPLEKSTYTEE